MCTTLAAPLSYSEVQEAFSELQNQADQQAALTAGHTCSDHTLTLKVFEVSGTGMLGFVVLEPVHSCTCTLVLLTCHMQDSCLP
jgi:hypothetical protein